MTAREGALIWAGRVRWAGGRESLGWFGLRERREGKKKRLGLGQKGKREKEMGFAFSFVKVPNKFNSNLNSRELKLELNNKQ